jgi:hypothetical protein
LTIFIQSLAFADDLLLLADNREKAQELACTEPYLQKLCMQIAAAKCASFEITTTKDSWYLTNPNLHLGKWRTNHTSSRRNIDLTWRTCFPIDLGCNPRTSNRLQGTLHRLRSASLKPHHRLHLPNYIIPHFLHATSLAISPITTFRGMDSLIRTDVKDILHLPASTPNGLIYCSKRSGGLGIPKYYQ